MPLGEETAMARFEQELKYFIEHQNELVREHRGKTLVLRGEKVEGVYDSPLDALIEAEKQWPIGTFMLQPCVPGPEAYTVTIA